MTDVLFYHLTASTLEEALPGLLERSLARGWNVMVQTGTEEKRDALDAHLWTYTDESFLAHCCDNEEGVEDAPIVLTTGPLNLNAAQVRFHVQGAVPPTLEGYERSIFMFDGHDDTQVQDARAQWKSLKAAGHQLTYWQQSEDKRWEKKA